VAEGGAGFQGRHVVALLVLACAALAAGGIYWFRTPKISPPSNLVDYLPSANASLIYVDVDAMRRSGILALVAGSKAAEDPDYQQFVNATKFDYRQDLDAIAGAFKDGRIYFALRGRFHWDSLKNYATSQGGSCHNDYCVVPGSQPDRRISFYPLQSGVMAMAIGPDDFAAYQVTPQTAKSKVTPPKDPMWAIIPAGSIQNMGSLPAVAKAYVPALQSAQQIEFSMHADSSNQLQLGIQISCKDAVAASALVTQLDAITKAFRQELEKTHRKPDPADLTGVLVAGTFRRTEREVSGGWTIPKAFVDAMASGAY
jgi:hypothetical protein